MKTFMLLFYGLEYKPEEMTSEDYAKAWQTWIAETEATGVVVSSLPFEWNGKRISETAVESIAMSTVDAGGYMLLKAESIEKASDIAKHAPHMLLGGTTIIRPCIEEGNK